LKQFVRPSARCTILTYGINTGIIIHMSQAKKITVELPKDLLQKAQKSSGKGITETIRQGLKLVAARDAYKQLKKMQGKVKFSIDLKSLREDR
jgi:hypothetical protein